MLLFSEVLPLRIISFNHYSQVWCLIWDRGVILFALKLSFFFLSFSEASIVQELPDCAGLSHVHYNHVERRLGNPV